MKAKPSVGKELEDRPREILGLIISSYIGSGEPVGSRTISKAIEKRLSPATIRNIMADLEDAGYLSQPHTSAGRVPSEKGYRFYVDCLGESPKPSRDDEKYIIKAMAGATTPEDMMSTASYLLSDICQNVGIVVAPSMESSVLQHIEFVRLDDGKVLVILVSKPGLVQQKLIRVSDPYTQEELTRAGNYLVEKFSGQTLPEIRRELVEMMEEEWVRYDRMMRSLLKSWSRSLAESEADAPPESVYVQGTGNILAQIDLSDIERMKELFRVFEEKERLVKILNACLPRGPDEGVRIMIGSELGAACMKDFTLITSPYLQQDSKTGFMGVIGPSRMEYRRGISVVHCMARVFGRMIEA